LYCARRKTRKKKKLKGGGEEQKERGKAIPLSKIKVWILIYVDAAEMPERSEDINGKLLKYICT
jgi:hypothetical protein